MEYFNTSNVKVQRKTTQCGCYEISNFNTSNVKVQQHWCSIYYNRKTISIHQMLRFSNLKLLEQKKITNFNTSNVKVQPDIKSQLVTRVSNFNTSNVKVQQLNFLWCLLMLIDFNTSNVKVQRQEPEQFILLNGFQYIKC